MRVDRRPLTRSMRVEIWSDVVCPWCYVGTRRFEEAVERFGGDVEVDYRAFELDASVPAGGMDLAEYLAHKFGGAGAVERAHDRLSHAGADVDIDFRWQGKRRVNTFDAHRLAAWAQRAAGSEARAAVEQRLFRAYFTDNVDISDHAALAGLAGEVGLDEALAAAALAAGDDADTVRAEEAQATELGISAVPTFVIAGRWAIPGAQDVDTFVEVLKTAAERLAPLTVAAPSARTEASDAASDEGACDDGSCAI
jgi:predicted DsbA family dithiol-disulfide isomerase